MNRKNQSHYSSFHQYQPVKSSEFIQDEFLIEDLTVKKTDGTILLKLPNFILIKSIQLFYLEHMVLVNRFFLK